MELDANTREESVDIEAESTRITWGLPQMVQKFYAIKSESAINKGMVISTVFATIVSGGCYFLGGFGRLFSDRIDIAANGYDSVVPAMLSGLPTILIAVVVILVLSAGIPPPPRTL